MTSRARFLRVWLFGAFTAASVCLACMYAVDWVGWVAMGAMGVFWLAMTAGEFWGRS